MPLFETPKPGTLTWNGGAVARFDLGTPGVSDRVAVESQLIKAGAGTYQFDFLGTGVTGTTYTLFTFAASPGFSASDFSYTNLRPGLSGTFELTPGALNFTTTGTARLNVIVTNTADSGPGSLRNALSNAAANAGPDTITFSPSLSGQVITLTSEMIISDTSGVALDATSLPARITIDGGPGTNRLFAVSPASPVSFNGFTFTGGGGSGGASGGKGGAILNNGGAITLAMCTFTGNSATGMGGAVANVNGGSITLSRCTLYGNSSATGGAISSFGSASLTLSQCTLSDNTATSGGALYSDSPLSFMQGTLAGNSATSGGAIYNDGALVLKNSIIAGNSATGSGIDVYNYAGTVTVTGANLIQFLVGAAADPSIISVPPLLAPLGNYGGTTKTMVLLPGSPARNAAVGSVFSFDQRGFPITGTPDLGACETGSVGNFAAWIWESLPAGASAAQHDASADFDGDGQNNLAEWLALTSPADTGDYFSANVVPSGAGVVITFRSAAGRSYRLRQSENLSLWTDAPNQLALTGDGLVKSFAVTGAGGRYFYQVAASVSLEQ